MKGVIVSIHIAPARGERTVSIHEAHAVPGKGLEGDRHFERGSPVTELTLIESEAIEALKRDYEIDLDPGNSRRNIVTQGVALNHLVGKDFHIGDVALRGYMLCEPCSHLEGMTYQGVMKGLTHRGGLRAQILTEGTIRVGDPIQVE